jgi:hypothetical protein
LTDYIVLLSLISDASLVAKGQSLFLYLAHTDIGEQAGPLLSLVSSFPQNFRLCVVGLAPAHAALKEEGGITAVDFNVGKTDRSEIKVTGKRKRVIGRDMCSLFD